MWRKRASYGFLCALAVVIGLTPSIILNVKPYWTHGAEDMAAVQFAFVILAAAIPLVLSEQPLVWSFVAWGLLCGLLYVSIGNGAESITLTRSVITSDREGKRDARGEWNTRIEEWDAEKQRLIELLKKGDKYTPVDEESLQAAKDKVENSCKFPTAGICITAQAELKQVTHDFGLTKRVDKLERDIDTARENLRKIGAPPPDYLAKAQEAFAGLPINPLKNKEPSMAVLGEVMAAAGPKFLIAAVNLLFAGMFGKEWWRESSPLRESLAAEIQPEAPITPPRSPHRAPIAGTKRLSYIPGVEAWVKAVAPIPGGKRKRYTPTQAHPHYVEFCRINGYTPCHVNVFGSIMKRECEMRPVVTIGGVSHYEFSITEPVQLALVKDAC